MSESKHTVGDELLRFYRENEFGEDGGASERFAKVKVGWFYVWIPNTEGRKRALLFHDIHHLVTNYGTDLRGEAEIGAWEIGSGCKNYLAAWVLNFMAMGLGCVIAPRRTWRAFWFGRKCLNLYHGIMTYDEVRSTTVEDVRVRLGLDADRGKVA